MRPPAALLLPLALAACGGPGSNQAAAGNSAGGNQAAAAAPADSGTAAPATPPAMAGALLQPGQWELTATVRALDAPGVPPARQAALRQRLGRPIVDRTCMTEAQTRDFARFANRDQLGHGCSIGDRVYANGIIRMQVSCPVPGRPGTMRMTTQGRYTPTSLDLAMTQEVPGPSGAAMRMSATISGRRIGACPAGGAGPTPRVPAPSTRVPVVVPAPPPPAR